MVAKEILARVAEADKERMLRALSMVGSGGYEVEIRHVSPVEVEGAVRKRIGKGYGGAPVYQPYLVTLTSTSASCSCPDAVYRGVTCKHCVALALWAIQHPQERPQEGEHRPHLKLARVRTTEELEREGFSC